MSIVKAFRFPVHVSWEGGRLTTASALGRSDLEIATPPEFTGGLAGYWSPEDLLVAATAGCYAVTLAAIAERMGLSLGGVEVSGTGHLSRKDDGRFGFVAIELDAFLSVHEDDVADARHAARQAEERCLITQALDVPVHVNTTVHAAIAVGAGG